MEAFTYVKYYDNMKVAIIDDPTYNLDKPKSYYDRLTDIVDTLNTLSFFKDISEVFDTDVLKNLCFFVGDGNRYFYNCYFVYDNHNDIKEGYYGDICGYGNFGLLCFLMKGKCNDVFYDTNNKTLKVLFYDLHKKKYINVKLSLNIILHLILCSRNILGNKGLFKEQLKKGGLIYGKTSDDFTNVGVHLTRDGFIKD